MKLRQSRLNAKPHEDAPRRLLSLTGPPSASEAELLIDLPFLSKPELLFAGSYCGPQPSRSGYHEGRLVPPLALYLRLAAGLRHLLDGLGIVHVPSPRFSSSPKPSFALTAKIPAYVTAHDLTVTQQVKVLHSLRELRNSFFFAQFAEIKAMNTPERMSRDARLGGSDKAAYLYATDSRAGMSPAVLRPDEANMYIWACLRLFNETISQLPDEFRSDDLTLLRAGFVVSRYVFRMMFQSWMQGERPLGWTLKRTLQEDSPETLCQYTPVTDHALSPWPPWLRVMGLVDLGKYARVEALLTKGTGCDHFFGLLKQFLGESVPQMTVSNELDDAEAAQILGFLDRWDPSEQKFEICVEVNDPAEPLSAGELEVILLGGGDDIEDMQLPCVINV